MITVSEIESSNWSISVNGFGEIVTDIVDIKQCHYIIVMTQKGSSPYMPEFGCSVFDYLDRPLLSAAPDMANAIKTALEKYEPRSTIKKVSYTLETDGTVNIKVEWTLSSLALGIVDFTTAFEIKDGVIYLVDEFNRYILTEYGIITL